MRQTNSDLRSALEWAVAIRGVTRAAEPWRISDELGPSFSFLIRMRAAAAPASASGGYENLPHAALRAFLFPQLPAFSLPLLCVEERPENRLPSHAKGPVSESTKAFLYLVIDKAGISDWCQ